jgi:hypothetical protein
MSFSNEPDNGREHAMRLVRHASTSWADAMRSHKMAPPDDGFAYRLKALSEAAATEQIAWEQAHAAGLAWRPVPGAENAAPPYELRPGTGRRGPEELWTRFDEAVTRLNHAIARPDSAELAAAFGGMAESAADLADAIARQDAATREVQERSRARRSATG